MRDVYNSREEKKLTDTQKTTDQIPEPLAKSSGSRSHQSKAKKSALVWLKPQVMALLGIGLLVGIVLGVHYWLFASSHVSTDNAYVTADVVQIAPQVSGTVQQVLVKENQEIKEGELLAVLDDSTYRVVVAQREADLKAAIAQAKGAGVSVTLTSESGNAQVQQASGAMDQAQSGIGSAVAEVARTDANVKGAIAMSHSAEANIGTAEAALNAAIANKKRSTSAIGAAQALIDASQASVRSAQAIYNRAAKDAKRYSQLAAEQAVSDQALEAATSSADAAQAQLDNARAIVVQREADLSAAQDQLEASDAAIAQAKAQLSASREQAEASRESIGQAEAQRKVAQQNVQQAKAKSRQALGALSQANTAPRQVAVSRSVQSQALAKIDQAKAALDAARLQLAYTRIYAPITGRISKKTVEVGALVQPGTPLMAIVSDTEKWVVANLKETQLSGIEPGRDADISVDALPGMVFHGKVDSISAATGATFALLPADNATGNFTKVVQRIPVKILIGAEEKNADLLRAGMSVRATIAVK